MASLSQAMDLGGHDEPNHSASPSLQHSRQPNGGFMPTKSPFEKSSSRPSANTVAVVNGASPHAALPRLEDLPEELVAAINTIPPQTYVPVARLVKRAVESCWFDLETLLEKLSKYNLPELRVEHDRLPNGQPNDTSSENRRKKMMLWDFAETRRRDFIKLLTILQWSTISEANRRTIGFNVYLHQVREHFRRAIEGFILLRSCIFAWEIPNPDLDTAAEVLAVGQVARLPDLGYTAKRDLSSAQVLGTLQRMNTLLSAKMAISDDIPSAMSTWRIHDGRVTFSVQDEFEVDLTTVDEADGANFFMVDFRFAFTPAPPIPALLLESIEFEVNTALFSDGLSGAYDFLHDLVLSQKLKELERQARNLANGLWAGHLKVEVLRRTLVVQYWLRRPGPKSWIEISVNSGRRISTDAVPYLHVRLVQHKVEVDAHDVMLDVADISLDDLLKQAVAHHQSRILGDIYDRLSLTDLYKDGDLEIEQTSSITNPHSCCLVIELSKDARITLAFEPVNGTLVVSPVSERATKMQADIARAKNVVDDFIARFPYFRAAAAEARLLKTMEFSEWQHLPALRPLPANVKQIFGSTTIRACLFRAPRWSTSWAIAAVFGINGDSWLLVSTQDANNLHWQAQDADMKSLHLLGSFDRSYFQHLLLYASSMITIQSNRKELERRGARCALCIHRNPRKASKSLLKFKFLQQHSFCTFKGQSVLALQTELDSSAGSIVLVLTELSAEKEVLDRLVSMQLDPSISINSKERRLGLKFTQQLGTSVVDTLLSRLHYIDDLISCVRLLHESPKLKLRSISLDTFTIVYHAGEDEELAIATSFTGASGEAKADFLPPNSNPHILLAAHVRHILSSGRQTLETRLERLLSALNMTLPLTRALRFLQGHAEQQLQQMSAVDLADSKQWLKVHVMCRDVLRFGMHFFSIKDNFGRDVNSQETPQKLLARFEIEPAFGKKGAKLGWLVRPAVEEFQSYNRPSYTAQALRKRLQDRIFRQSPSRRWICLDTAAKCSTADPYSLLAALHQAILEWLKEASANPSSIHTKSSVTNPVVANNKKLPNQSPATQASKLTQKARANATAAPNSKQQTSQPSSRVMTAPPQQQYAGPPNQQQQRARMAAMQNQQRQQQQMSKPNPNQQNAKNPMHGKDVITLD